MTEQSWGYLFHTDMIPIPRNTVAKAYCNRDKRDVIGYSWVFRKYKKSIVLYHESFEGMELYTVKQLVKVLSEVPYST